MSDLNDKSPETDELDQLLNELAPTKEERAALLEEHRQLEKDLLRLADPAPPFDFVHKVMAKVAREPAKAPARVEVWWALGIVGVTLAASVVAFVAQGDGVGELGLSFTRALMRARELLVAAGSGLSAVWKTAALPLTVGMMTALFFGLFGLKRLMGGAVEART